MIGAWSEGDIAYLVEHYPKEGGKCAVALGRSYGSVNHKACRLRIRRDVAWSAEEDTIVRERYRLEGARGLGSVLDRTEFAIAARASKLGVKCGTRWLQAETEALLSGLARVDTARLSTELGKSRLQICGKLRKMGYSVLGAELDWVRRDMEAFSDTELSYLAGFIDGEGTISLHMVAASHITPRVYIVNTNPRYFDWLLRRVHLMTHIVVPRRGNAKAKHLVSLAGVKTLPFLEAIEPYLVLKKEHAELVIRYINGRLGRPRSRYTDEERQIALRVTELNERGVRN